VKEEELDERAFLNQPIKIVFDISKFRDLIFLIELINQQKGPLNYWRIVLKVRWMSLCE